MHEKFLKPYDPTETEARIYAEWEKSGLFNPDACVKQGFTHADAPTYSIVLPPPNVTGRLHIGHTLMLTIQDILIRYKRMYGFRTLWVPGTDHAAIATQSVVEKQIKKDENKSRHDLGREELLKRVQAFAKNNHDTIVNQIKKIGASLDWTREAFTLDEKRNNVVTILFKKMYAAGLIYRGNRIVNWDPKGQTTISDDEIIYEERAAKLYTFRYSKDFPISIATTRPETKVGDVGVAVHPDDARYQQFIGKEYDAVFCDVLIHIKIVADKEVDPLFGTGAVGLTPAHSQIDWDIAERHGLSRDAIVINEFTKMTVTGRLEGKKTNEAREIVVAWLTSEGLLEKTEDTIQNIATAERTGGIIEPLPKLQWFVDVHKALPDTFPNSGKTLKDLMLDPVRSGAIKIIPEYSEKTYFNWIEGLRDWCISRQIWYGHRIPVWYKGEEMVVGDAPTDEGWMQDEDTLDTWFSSGTWTFSVMGWPDQNGDFKTYHPTDVLETGYDIIFFWVARMILMTEFALDTIPFKTVYLNGLVRDAQGRKMSKSLGNNLDPLDITNKFGTDACRMSLIVGNTPGTDMCMSEDKIKAYKHFANKLWNVARFILENANLIMHKENANEQEIGRAPGRSAKSYPQFLVHSHFLLGRAQFLACQHLFSAQENEHRAYIENLIKDVTKDIDEYRMYLAAEKIYHYVWHELADKILEESKPILAGADAGARAARAHLLVELLDHVLHLLHPFMPFITEEIYQEMQTKNTGLLMVSPWPQPHT